MKSERLCPTFILHLQCPKTSCDVLSKTGDTLIKSIDDGYAELVLLELMNKFVSANAEVVGPQIAQILESKLKRYESKKSDSAVSEFMPHQKASVAATLCSSIIVSSKKRARPDFSLRYIDPDHVMRPQHRHVTDESYYISDSFHETQRAWLSSEVGYLPAPEILGSMVMKSNRSNTGWRAPLGFDDIFFNSDYLSNRCNLTEEINDKKRKTIPTRKFSERYRAPQIDESNSIMSIIATSHDAHLSQTVHVTKDILKSAVEISQVAKKFILARAGSILLCVDQHAADERVRLEALQAQIYSRDEHTGFKQSPLVRPMLLTLSDYEANLLEIYSSRLRHYGFDFSIIDTSSKTSQILIRATPEILGVELSADDIRAVLHQLKEYDPTASGLLLNLAPFHYILCAKACRSAIMFGDSLSHEECSHLLSALSQCDLPFQCAHGRPSSVILVDDLKALAVRSAKIKSLASRRSSGARRARRYKLRFDELIRRT